MEVIVLAWVGCALLGAVIGAARGRPGAGFLLGLLLGVIGVIIALFLTPPAVAPTPAEPRVPCPHCAEQILPAANVCPFCGNTVQAIPLDPPRDLDEGWYPDPSGRHPDRWWDGTGWTKWVRDRPGGTRSEDPPLPRLV